MTANDTDDAQEFLNIPVIIQEVDRQKHPKTPQELAAEEERHRQFLASQPPDYDPWAETIGGRHGDW